jgi:ribose transport system permease protein
LAIYAIGSDEERARLSGVRVDRVKVACFVIGGGLAGLGGVYLAGMTSTGTPTAGDSYILLTFAAVVIGGTSLRGGSGGLGLSVVGAFIEIIISDLVLAENLATWVATLASALLLLAVITIQALASKELARGAT